MKQTIVYQRGASWASNTRSSITGDKDKIYHFLEGHVPGSLGFHLNGINYCESYEDLFRWLGTYLLNHCTINVLQELKGGTLEEWPYNGEASTMEQFLHHNEVWLYHVVIDDAHLELRRTADYLQCPDLPTIAALAPFVEQYNATRITWSQIVSVISYCVGRQFLLRLSDMRQLLDAHPELKRKMDAQYQLIVVKMKKQVDALF